MHWILTVTNTFSLSQVIQRSQWLLYPPFTASLAEEVLYRVEGLASGHTVALTITQAPAGLVLHTNERLTGRETEELSHKVWRMLRLGENLDTFLEIARRTPGLETTIQHGAILLRGSTFFEDVVKAIIFVWEAENRRTQRITWLVDRFGDPLPSNPTMHAFPTPQQLLWGQHLMDDILGPALVRKLISIAELFETQSARVQALTRSLDLPLDRFEAKVQQLFDLDAAALGLVMLALGRYDYIPIDERTQERVSRCWYKGRDIDATETRAPFMRWQPWGGLAYWLWNWSAAQEVWGFAESEVMYGKLKNQCWAR